MYYKLTGRQYVEQNSGQIVQLADLQFMVAIGDYIEKFGVLRKVTNIVYLENGGVMLELTEVEAYGA